MIYFTGDLQDAARTPLGKSPVFIENTLFFVVNGNFQTNLNLLFVVGKLWVMVFICFKLILNKFNKRNVVIGTYLSISRMLVLEN